MRQIALQESDTVVSQSIDFHAWSCVMTWQRRLRRSFFSKQASLAVCRSYTLNRQDLAAESCVGAQVCHRFLSKLCSLDPTYSVVYKQLGSGFRYLDSPQVPSSVPPGFFLSLIKRDSIQCNRDTQLGLSQGQRVHWISDAVVAVFKSACHRIHARSDSQIQSIQLCDCVQ